MEIECDKNKFGTTSEVYAAMRKTIDVNDIELMPDKHSYNTFVHRRKRQHEPIIPLTYEDFDMLINNDLYKERYSESARGVNKLFIII